MNTYRYCQNHPRGNWRAGEYQCSEGRNKREFCKEGKAEPVTEVAAMQKRLRAEYLAKTRPDLKYEQEGDLL